MERRGGVLAAGALVLSAACWGFATVMSKGALETLPPLTLLGIQVTASAAFLWMAVIATRAPVQLAGHGRAIAATGLLEPGLAYAVALPGLALTSAGDASIIAAAEPAFICALVWGFGRRRPPKGMPPALMVASIGLLLVTVSGPDMTGAAPATGQRLAGNALVLLGTGLAALYVVASQRLAGALPALPLAALQQSAGLAFVLLLLAGALATGLEVLPAHIPAPVLLLAALSGVVQYALAVWLYLFGLSRVPADKAGLFLALIPVFGIAGAALALGEMPGPLQLAGAALVAGAVARIARLQR